MRVQSIVKSLAVAVAGAGIVSFFLMMAIIPALALMQRLTGNIAQQSEVVNPQAFMRSYGIPAAAVAFVILFFLAMRRFRQHEQTHMAQH